MVTTQGHSVWRCSLGLSRCKIGSEATSASQAPPHPGPDPSGEHSVAGDAPFPKGKSLGVAC